LLARYTGSGDEEESRRDRILSYVTKVSPKTPGGQAAAGGVAGW